MSAPTLGGEWRQRLLELKPDWDSYGAKPISAAAIITLCGFSTVPCSDGGIQLEVHLHGFDVEIRIGPDGRIESAWIVRATPTAP